MCQGRLACAKPLRPVERFGESRFGAHSVSPYTQLWTFNHHTQTPRHQNHGSLSGTLCNDGLNFQVDCHPLLTSHKRGHIRIISQTGSSFLGYLKGTKESVALELDFGVAQTGP